MCTFTMFFHSTQASYWTTYGYASGGGGCTLSLGKYGCAGGGCSYSLGDILQLLNAMLSSILNLKMVQRGAWGLVSLRLA